MTMAGEGPIGFGEGVEELVPEIVDPTRDEDDRVTHVEIADFATVIEPPPVPRFGWQAHLASLRNPYIACALHSISIQGTPGLCLVPVG